MLVRLRQPKKPRFLGDIFLYLGHARAHDKLYAGLPKLSDKLRSRRVGIAGHCVRHPA